MGSQIGLRERHVRNQYARAVVHLFDGRNPLNGGRGEGLLAVDARTQWALLAVDASVEELPAADVCPHEGICQYHREIGQG